MQGRRRHIGFHPAWGNAVHINSMCCQLSRKTFHHTDDSALAGCVVAVKRFATLSSGGADQHYMTSGTLALHLCHTVFHQAEDTIHIDGERGSPLLVSHLVDGRITGRPDAMVSNDDVQRAEMLNRSLN